MKRTLTTAAALLSAALLSLPAAAQKSEAGLWEYRIALKSGSGRMEGAMAQMQQEMAKMSPEQRKAMEQMMASQGMGMAPGGGAANTVRMCVSKEQAARDEMPTGDDRCRQTSLTRSGSTLRFAFVCEGNPPTKGEGSYTFQGGRAFSGQTAVDTVVDGKPERIESHIQGQWLGADCGNVKPAGGKR
ncbi:MAG: DUF3617 domain-containing protein [Rubrivivax sp.]|nr:DUF3617 domain-containing protein [Rubrivivax sp.]